MSLTDRSERAVAALLDDLADRYGAFETVEKTWEHSRAGYEAVVERFEAGAFGGAGVWVTNDEGQVLLVRNEGDDGWGDPGGKAEPGESVEETARREVREEAGIECRLTGICQVHVVGNRCAACDEPLVYEAIVVFRGDHVGGTPAAREGEIADVAWFAEPPDHVLYDEVRTMPFPASE